MPSIWTIVIVVMLLSFFVQRMLDSRFNKYSKVSTPNNLTGAEIARKMLADNGITDVKVGHVPGKLTDHYNPVTKTLNLSDAVYGSASIAAAAVAAHECGHAVQHSRGYAPLRLRSALVPLVNFANRTVQWVLLLGVICIETFPGILWAGILLFGCTTFFSILTLPVEINASYRAVEWLENSRIAVGEKEKWPKMPSNGRHIPM